SYGAPRDPHSFPTRRSSDLWHRKAIWCWRSSIAAARVMGASSNLHRGEDGQPTKAGMPSQGRITCDRSATPVGRSGSSEAVTAGDRKSTRLNSSHVEISYAV